jgi:hypothetical protein
VEPDFMLESDALEATGREDHAVEFAGRAVAEARLHVAADRHHREIRPCCAQRRGPTQR